MQVVVVREYGNILFEKHTVFITLFCNHVYTSANFTMSVTYSPASFLALYPVK